MKKILYIVSTLSRSGPTNQLFNLIKYLDREQFEPYLITLTPEPNDSRWDDYAALGVKLYSLNLSRVKGVLLAKRKVKTFIDKIEPDLIHSQGIRADVLIGRLDTVLPKVLTIHNYPQKDYFMRYFRIQSFVMLRIHLSAFKKFNLCICVSCSVEENARKITHANEFKSIENGVDTVDFYPISLNEKNKLRKKLKLPENGNLWVSSGRISSLKDPLFLINQWKRAFSSSSSDTLVVLGDGEVLDECRRIALGVDNIIIKGRVSNVLDYLQASDYYLSASKSEGLPMAAIEALACGLPCLLSNIEPHAEIVSMNEKIGKLFELGNSSSFSENITAIQKQDYASMREAALDLISTRLSAEVMSKKYQDAYLELMNK